ncbi:MAG TPA: polysaccharide deacetylase family protein [Dokdonella sp.]|uniref:polysaccharide deacetylase family protein n=2 Tax=Dokdonella sp. TaxID=2291710 RepID=UPI002D1A3A2F|nr:polysaccharide deacetylase family protein [Dokdonella sp.]HOX72374.1 polysaccharide deacetylase family protein [Dokdonella sp.]HPG94388.1 polysaccharide deacetylase family protein [Dokdonella sp.]
MNPRPNKLQLFKWLPNSWMMTTGPVSGNALYLTFDDGPNVGYTERVLDVLAAHSAKATFFLLGEQVEAHPAVVRRIVDEDHQLGNHSYNHPRFTRIPHSQQLSQIERTERLLAAIDGKREHRFRPPSGRFPLSLLLHFAMNRSSMAYWSYDSLDYTGMPAEKLIDVLRGDPPRAGDIVLLHDDNDATVELLNVMLPEWRKAGFELRALPELASA